MQNYSKKLHIYFILNLAVNSEYILVEVCYFCNSFCMVPFLYVCIYICIFPPADFHPVQSEREQDEAVSAACGCVSALCICHHYLRSQLCIYACTCFCLLGMYFLPDYCLDLRAWSCSCFSKIVQSDGYFPLIPFQYGILIVMFQHQCFFKIS